MRALAPVAALRSRPSTSSAREGTRLKVRETAMGEGARIGSTVVAVQPLGGQSGGSDGYHAKMVGGFAQELAYLATMPNDADPPQGQTGHGEMCCVGEPISLERVRTSAMCSAAR